MGPFLPILLLGGLAMLGGSPSGPSKPRTWNPAGFVTPNIYVVQPGDEHVRGPEFPPKHVTIITDSLSVEQIVDVVRFHAQECPNQFYFIYGSDNIAILDGKDVTEPSGRVGVSVKTPGAIPSQQVINATPADLDIALEDPIYC